MRKKCIDQCIYHAELLKELEQKSFISEQQVMSMYKILETLIEEKPKYIKQLKLCVMFAKINEKVAADQSKDDHPSAPDLASTDQAVDQPSISGLSSADHTFIESSHEN